LSANGPSAVQQTCNFNTGKKSVIFPKLLRLGNWNLHDSTGHPRQAYSIERYQQEWRWACTGI